ncbi:MAG TPA: hypothetical protein VL137_01075 [Polyangiaceae bacterium]|jgi:hypothetical protein|nr:hypothetical protein [Polyangiaceae bacterium]
MRFDSWYLLLLAPFALLASQGQYGAQLLVMALTLGIFFGTVSLRKVTGDAATTTHSGRG